jgi:quinol monooxygenase YgiN
MVRLTLRIRTVPGETPPLTTALHSLMLEARAEYACGACSLSTVLGTCAIITYVEEWQNESALRAQVRSIRFTRLLALAEHATDTPLVEFQLDDRTRGLDYAEEVRAMRPPEPDSA